MWPNGPNSPSPGPTQNENNTCVSAFWDPLYEDFYMYYGLLALPQIATPAPAAGMVTADQTLDAPTLIAKAGIAAGPD